MSADIDPEAIDAAGDEIEAADENTTRTERWFARAFMLVLTFVVGVVLAALIYTGYVDLAAIVEDSSMIEWAVELVVVVAGTAVAVFIVAMLVKAVGGAFLNRLATGFAIALDNYDRPGSREDGSQEEG
jgi:F0F1-type ATP synthase assembly protein I